MNCNQCNNPFVPIRSTSKYCSKSCRDKSYNQTCRERRKADSYRGKAIKVGVCEWCDNTFEYRQTKELSCCSKSCAAYIRANTSFYKERPLYTRINTGSCAVCDKSFVSKVLSERYCKDCNTKHDKATLANIAKGGKDKICRVCKVLFCLIDHSSNHVTCSDKCLVESRRTIKSMAQLRRRGRMNIDAEKFDPFYVFSRDKWKCQCCGLKLSKKNRGKNLPKSPELDHIIPISKGGKHTRANTQLLCKSCNSAKRDRTVQGEQLWLIG